jgi:TolB-like protein/tetratricopeptide (TPR) repeat protein
MASTIPVYVYDIFISYRQNDNRYDGWVTEFVANLNKELEATIKDKVNVYFDANPQDGLLETHSVDRSLEDKLKCLIFIPILSRTYCDPNSYAWNNEFLAFLKIAREDSIGLNVKLSSGNVASRILPIRIHDLNPEDIALVESKTGVIRAIDFIYHSQGVNRPLRQRDDDMVKSTQRLVYRDQLNKVANSIDEIIRSLKRVQTTSEGGITKNDQPDDRDKKEDTSNALERKSSESMKSKKWFILLLALSLFILGVFTLYNIIYRDKRAKDVSKQDKSIAVLPFVNDSPDKENEYFCNGIMDEILTQLQKIHDMKVKSRTDVEKYRNPDKSIKVIGKELGVSYIMEGSVRKIGDDLRVTTQLIDTKNSDHLWAETYDGKYSTKIFEFQSSVAKRVAASLNALITPNEEKRIDTKPTNDLLAHSLTLKGGEMIVKWWFTYDYQYLRLASNFFNEALKIDPNYIEAKAGKGNTYELSGKYDSAMIYFEEVLKIDPENRRAIEGSGSIYMKTNQPDSAIKYYKKQVEINPKDLYAYYNLGKELIFGQNEVIKGLSFLQKAYDLGGDSSAAVLMNIGFAYFYIGEYSKALKYIKRTLLLEPDWCGIDQYYFNMLSIQSNLNEANNFIDSIQNFTRCQSACDIMRFYYYTLRRDFKKAEDYSNKVLNVAPSAFINSDRSYDIYLNYLLKENGKKNEAIKGLKNSIEFYKANILKSYGWDLQINRLKIAASYSMLGEKDKAMDYLSQLVKFGLFEYPITLSFPGFDNLRSDPEFKTIVKRIEDQRVAVREKVREMEQSGEIHL